MPFTNLTHHKHFKTVVFVFLFIFFSINSRAQISQNGIYFQAIAKDNFDHPANRRNIYIQSNVIQSSSTGPKVLIEEFQTITDEAGIFTITIGKGIRKGGLVNTLSQIDWANGPFFLNLKIVITPIAPAALWDYSKEWIDLGTTSFGTVPYALYAGTAAGLSDKLSITDTTNMLSIYAKMTTVKIIEHKVNTKIAITDTAAMLAPYKKIVNELIASKITTLTADAINNALNSKVSLVDSNIIYVTPTKLAASAYDPTAINKNIALKANTSDVTNSLTTKVDLSDSTIKYVTPTQLAAKTFDLAPVNASIATKVDKISGMGLSTNDFTTVEKSKLGTITGTNTGDQDLSAFATTTALALKANLSDINISLSLKPNTTDVNTNLNNKLNIADTSAMLSVRIKRDTSFLSNRINLKENESNKSSDIVADALSESKYPSVKAIKTYVDGTTSSGVADADPLNKGKIKLAGDLGGTADAPIISNDAITTNKVLDAAITNAKIASGINASKVGLGNVTNHTQLYNLNGLTEQLQNFATPGISGLSPNWTSVGSDHVINIPMANASSVTAGLISKPDYDHFNTAYTTSINALTTNSNNGTAILTGQSLNIPNYSIIGLSGTINPNYILAGPITGVAGTVQYRALVAADIPDNIANTSGNASTASKLQSPASINNIAFDGSANINIKASTTNKLLFSVSGDGANTTDFFDGSSNKTLSYNTVGAAPLVGSSNITTLGTISTGIWNGTVVGSSVGGAGNVNGLLKANGNGLVSAASAVSDYQIPLNFIAPLINATSSISINQANTNTAGYLSSADWNTFNNKISASEKAIANGVATLNALGKIPTAQIPAISFSSGYVVNSQTEMLALTAAVLGSIAIRTDNSKNYVLSTSDPALLANWLELLMPAAVSSVNGYTTGSIVLTSSDINEGTNLYFSNARVKSAVDGFLGGDAPLSYTASTGKMTITQATTNSSGYLSSTDWNTFNNKMATLGTQSANTIYAAPNGIGGAPIFRTLVAADIPTLNQNTTGNAATSTALLNTKSINGIGFNGTADITISANTNNAIIFSNSGTGAATLSSFNGASPMTISYNSIGASPIVGSASLTTLGTITAGTWNANIIGSNYGGAGANNGILKANGSGSVSTAVAGSDYESPLSFTAPLSKTSNTISIQTATSSNTGALSSSDWQLFNNKQATLVAGTGVTMSGGNTLSIGQAVASISSPSFAGISLTGLNVSGIVTNNASGVLSTLSTTGTGLVVKENTPTLITPNIGAANATSIIASGDITAKRFKLTMPNATAASTTTALDLSTGNVFTINLSLNVTTFNLTNPAVGTYLIKFVQDATGSRDVTFPTSWKWAGGVIPNLTNTPNKLDIVTLIYDGNYYYTTIVQNF
jgi:hypothetical protein